MTFKRRITSIIKNLSLLYFLLLVLICILFGSIALTIPESAVSERIVVSMIGSTFFFAIINIILSNAISLQRVNQEIRTQLNDSSVNVSGSTVNSMFTNIINVDDRYKTFISLILGTIFGITLFFLSTSHYLFYVVDNSGSMGTCPNWTSEKGCPQPLLNPDESTVKSITKYLDKEFDDKSLGSTYVSKSSLPIFPPYEFTSDVKVGLIEIGGKTSLNGQCIAKELAEPVLNNQKQLLEGLTKINANDDGVTALIKALKKADSSINLKTSNPLKYAASKNVILFTDSYEDNCEGSKRDFCEATSELPEGFNVKLNIYGIRDTNTSPGAADKEFSCDKFECGKKYSAARCKVISVDQIKQSSIPELRLRLSLSPRLATTSYTSLALSLICIIFIFGMILKYREELWNSYSVYSPIVYLSIVYSFIDDSNRKIKKAKNHIIEFLQQEERVPRFGLLIVLVVFVVILGILLLFR